MPNFANLRQQFFTEAQVSSISRSDEECLIADVRCRISPVQAVERKLGMMLGREKSFRDFSSRANGSTITAVR